MPVNMFENNVIRTIGFTSFSNIMWLKPMVLATLFEERLQNQCFCKIGVGNVVKFVSLAAFVGPMNIANGFTNIILEML